MDSLLHAAARALAAGDALGALKRVALREDPSALAVRGIALARLGEFARARELLRRAARGFGPNEKVARARCVLARAEVLLATRELGASTAELQSAARTLAAHGDSYNASHAQLLLARRFLLIGRLDDAERALARLDVAQLAPTSRVVAELAKAELALRGLHIDEAEAALARADRASVAARVPELAHEVNEVRSMLERPAARRRGPHGYELLRVAELGELVESGALVLDTGRRLLRTRVASRSLLRRPVPFALLEALAAAWPGEVERDVLITGALGARRPNESHRVRLRVELGRLRALVLGLARIEPTRQGFALRTEGDRRLVVIDPPIDGQQALLLALLADGVPWSTSALALALDASQRTIQRALVELQAEGRVHAVGRARAQRWLAPPLSGITPILLLPALLPLA